MFMKTINENTLQDPISGTISNFPVVKHNCTHTLTHTHTVLWTLRTLAVLIEKESFTIFISIITEPFPVR